MGVGRGVVESKREHRFGQSEIFPHLIMTPLPFPNLESLHERLNHLLEYSQYNSLKIKGIRKLST